jgi:hypothetical protein
MPVMRAYIVMRSAWATSNGYNRRLNERQTEFRVIGSPQADGMHGGMDQPGERCSTWR